MKQESISGVVMEVDRKYFILLTHDGDFKKIKRKNKYNPQVGEKVTIQKVDVLPTHRYLTTYYRMTILLSIILVMAAMIFFVIIFNTQS